MKALRWPAIPRVVQGMGGPITVKLLKRVSGDAGEPCHGTWEAATRTIRLERCGRIEHKWRVLHHELVHAALDDAGISYLLTDEAQETLADALASAQIAKMLGELAT